MFNFMEIPVVIPEAQVTFKQVRGYYIRTMAEYAPLGIRAQVVQGRWNDAGTMSDDQAKEEALAILNKRANELRIHLKSLTL